MDKSQAGQIRLVGPACLSNSLIGQGTSVFCTFCTVPGAPRGLALHVRVYTSGRVRVGVAYGYVWGGWGMGTVWGGYR